ncbi:MAG: hypothetical protein WC383_16605, partial [Gammaproteobacteria bacterium]
ACIVSVRSTLWKDAKSPMEGGDIRSAAGQVSVTVTHPTGVAATGRDGIATNVHRCYENGFSMCCICQTRFAAQEDG